MPKMSMPTPEEMRRRAFERQLYDTLRTWMRARNILPEHDQFAEMLGVILNMHDLFHGEASDKVNNFEKVIENAKAEMVALSNPAPIMFCAACPHRPPEAQRGDGE